MYQKSLGSFGHCLDCMRAVLTVAIIEALTMIEATVSVCWESGGTAACCSSSSSEGSFNLLPSSHAASTLIQPQAALAGLYISIFFFSITTLSKATPTCSVGMCQSRLPECV